jgi:type IV pilus assembly protein PilM
MARSRSPRLFSLNLGMQTVSMAEFELLPNGGLKLASFSSTELIVDPAADATRPAQLETVAKDLRVALNAKSGTEVNLCLPSQAVFSRFVKLPGETALDVQSIIGFEAQQNVPFPIDEVVWDHQIMGERNGETWDVALVAIKADQLGEVIDSVKIGGLSAATVDIAPLALYNAFRYSYPEANGCSLIIDLGARTTNLIFSENGRLFNRSIPIGGNSITGAIAKEFAQDITLSEKLKLDRGSVGLGGAYAEPADPTEARMAKVIRNTMTRLHAEIARSINFYRTSQGGTAPERVYLYGGSTGLPYMAEFFGEKLQTQVEFLNPLKNVMVPSGVLPEGTSPCSSGLGELVGSALRALKNCPIEINLTPPNVLQSRMAARRLPALAVAALFLIITPGLWWLYFNKSATVIDAGISSIDSRTTELSGYSKKIDQAMKEKDDIARETVPFLLAATERSIWTAILEDLGNRMPPRFIWVTQLTPVEGTIKTGEPETVPQSQPPGRRQQQPPGRKAQPTTQNAEKAITHIQIKGLYLDTPPNPKGARVIDEFFENLQSSEVFSIGNDRAAIITERTTPSGDAWAYGYTLLLPLKQPIAVP